MMLIMYKQIFFIIALSFVMSSCNFLFRKKQDFIIDNSIIIPIDFASIDAYPLLPECKNIHSRKAQKACFYTILSKQIEVSLSKSIVSLSQPIQDTIFVKLQVSDKGVLKVSSVNLSIENKEDKKNVTELIFKSLVEFSPIEPGIKSGIPVTTEFTLPIILKTE